MKLLVSLLEGNNQNIKQNSVLWNMIASMAFAFQSAILLLCVTRAGGLFIAGIFSISYTVSQMFSSIGNYTMRDYQVSDTYNKYSFSTYVTSRYFTVVFMFIVCFLYSVFNGYSGEKLIIIMILCVYRAVDDIEDVFHGEIQKKGRLDVASRILAVRIIVASAIFCVVFAITKNLFMASLSLTISAICISLFLNWLVCKVYGIAHTLESKGVWKLLISCLPICAGAFLYNYLVNSPKYAINAILSEDMQTIFNILFMPVFVTNMVGMFIFKPYVLELGESWNSGKIRSFLGLCCKLSAAIMGIAVVVVIGGALVGLPVLSMIYGIDLSQYRGLFVVLLIFGGISALNSFALVILTVMRRQYVIIVAYIIALLINTIFMNRIVMRYQLMGAGMVYGLAMSVVLGIFILCIAINFVGRNKVNR